MFTHPSSKPKDDAKPESNYVRWKFDPNATDFHVEPTELVNLDGEMPKVDDRFLTKKYRYIFLSISDPNAEYSPIGGTYNAIGKADIATGKYEYWSAGEHTALHEVAFAPRSPAGMIVQRASRQVGSLLTVCPPDSTRGRRIPDHRRQQTRRATFLRFDHRCELHPSGTCRRHRFAFPLTQWHSWKLGPSVRYVG